MLSVWRFIKRSRSLNSIRICFELKKLCRNAHLTIHRPQATCGELMKPDCTIETRTIPILCQFKFYSVVNLFFKVDVFNYMSCILLWAAKVHWIIILSKPGEDVVKLLFCTHIIFQKRTYKSENNNCMKRVHFHRV